MCKKHRGAAKHRTAASKLIQQHAGASGSQARWPEHMPCTMHVWHLAPTAPMQPCAAKPRASKRPAQGGTRPKKPCRSQDPSQGKNQCSTHNMPELLHLPNQQIQSNGMLHSLSKQTGPPSKGFAEPQQAPAEQQTPHQPPQSSAAASTRARLTRPVCLLGRTKHTSLAAALTRLSQAITACACLLSPPQFPSTQAAVRCTCSTCPNILAAHAATNTVQVCPGIYIL